MVGLSSAELTACIVLAILQHTIMFLQLHHNICHCMQLSPLRALVGGLAYAACTPWACHPELPHERARPSHRIVTSSREPKGAHSAKALQALTQSYYTTLLLLPQDFS